MRREASGFPRRTAPVESNLTHVGELFEQVLPNGRPACRRKHPKVQAPEPALLSASGLRNAPDARDTKGVAHVPLGAQRSVELLKQHRHQSRADQGEHDGWWKKQEWIE